MAGPKMAFAYLRSDTQALPLIAGHTHTIGRKPECDLSLDHVGQPHDLSRHVLVSTKLL